MKGLPQFDLRQYTPSLLARIYEQTVARDLREKVIAVRGIYRDRNKYSGTGKKNHGCYGGFYYDSLVDQMTGKKLTLKIPEKLKAELQDGNIYLFRGNIENKLKQSKDISLDFLLVSDQILSEEPCEADEIRHKEETRLYEKKRLRTGFDVDRTLRQLFHSGKRPRVSILYGNNGIVDSDVETALRGTGDSYLLRNARVSLADKNMIIEKIKKIENYSDIIAIVRGGGSGLEVFDDIDLANAVLNTRVPVVAAIGHDQDNTLVKRIADKAFSTPTAFGNYLREMALGIGKDREVEGEVRDDIQKQGSWGLVWGVLFVVGILLLLLWRS